MNRLAALVLPLVLLFSAAACRPNRIHHGEMHCYAEDGREVPCVFPTRTP